MPQKKILILTASPDDKARLRADKEIKAIEEELERSKNRNKFRIIPKLAVTPDDLIRVLQEEEPEIVHFCGHGQETGLVFENESGAAQTVRAEALAKLFERFKDKVECVLLNACYTDTQGEAIKKHIQYVIGMTEQIEDTAAIKFAANFYATLMAGRSYKDAYEFGCIALDLLGIQDDLLPVFLEKSQPIEPKLPVNPPPPEHYNDVIYAFKNGQVIPFLGAGINLFDGQSLNQIMSDIKRLAKYLAENLGVERQYQDLVECPVCLVGAEELPDNCPVKKAWLDGTVAVCPLANEQAFAVAKLNLECLAQYEKLRTSNIQDVYQNLKLLFDKRYSTNKLHQFFANIPQKMTEKTRKEEYVLPYKLLVTTNYDNLLERAFEEAGQRFDLVFYVAEGEQNKGHFQYQAYGESPLPVNSDQEVLKKDRPVILKLYGAAKNLSFVITEEHHINYLIDRKIDQLLPKDILEILWEDHNILFMGYSPIDADLRIIINRLWGERKIGKQDRESWMIHQSKPGLLNKKFWKQRKVELLESNLENYLTELNKTVEALPSPKTPYELWSE